MELMAYTGHDVRKVVCPLKCCYNIAHEAGHSPSTQVGGEEVEHLQWQGRVATGNNHDIR